MEEGWPSGWSVERAVIMTPLRVSRVGKWTLPLVVNSDDVDNGHDVQRRRPERSQFRDKADAACDMGNQHRW